MIKLSEKIQGKEINIGPQHPALKEPETFRIVIESEKIVDAIPILGHTHRGIEKLCESRNSDQNLYLIERICGICSFSHQGNYAKGVEEIAGIEAPPRANYIRVIVAELERLHSHLLWLGVLTHEIGFDTFYLLIWKDRELIMDILETITGNRVNYGVNAIGGVRNDLNEMMIKQLFSLLPILEQRIQKIKKIAVNDKTIQARCKNVGTISKKLAEKTNATGPTARSSGINWDLRRDNPYFVYEEIKFKVLYDTKGDVYSKIILRLDELFESISIIDQALNNLPNGPILSKIRGKFNGATISRIEAPRGEDLHYIDFRNDKIPYRIKVRAPTYANLVSSMNVLVGHHIADIPVIVASCDPCFSCTDRTLVIDRDLDKQYIMNSNDLRNFAIKVYQEDEIL